MPCAAEMFPIIFAPCESVDPAALKWLLDRGANPNCATPVARTALDYVIGTYARSPERLSACIDLLLDAGGTTRYDAPGVLDVLRRPLDRLAKQLEADPQLVHRRFPELDCGSTGGRRLLLQGATLLHVAAEFGVLDAARLLLDRGADVNARATGGRCRRRWADGHFPRGHTVSGRRLTDGAVAGGARRRPQRARETSGTLRAAG